MKMLMGIAALALVSWVIAAAVVRYRSTDGAALITAFRNSATIALAEALKVAGAAIEIIDAYGDIAQDPAVPKLLAAVGMSEGTSGVVLAAIGFAVSAARKRTL